MKIEIVKSEKIEDRRIEVFRIYNYEGLEISLMSYGATLTSVLQADRTGRKEEVTLGFDTPSEYEKERSFFGASIGRYGNRIANGRFSINENEYSLAVNNGPNHLHGGIEGFDRQIWKAVPFEESDRAGVIFSRTSPDGEEGYPGNLRVEIRYTLTFEDILEIDYKAETDRNTIINLTNHTFWNLAGTGNVKAHYFQSPADRYIPVDDTLIPLGEICPVENTPFDFRMGKLLGKDFTTLTEGYDHCYILPGNPDKKTPVDELKELGTVIHRECGRKMELWTNQPGFQLYTSAHLNDMHISNGRTTEKFGAFCLETQNLPDSPNQPNFPSPILKPGETYTHRTVHKFSTI